MKPSTCTCGQLARLWQRHCNACHAAYMREWRKTHPLSAAQRRKASTRAQTRMMVKRGQIERQPCEVCGVAKVERHHDDYSKPRAVRWLCRPHHLAHHATTEGQP